MPDQIRSIEIYYDIANIPGVDVDAPDALNTALDFRNDAMHLIEAALEKDGLGEWEGAEIGMGEVNFGFEVTNFEAAETTVRAVVKDTPYACIREITRSEFDPSEFEA